MSENDDSKALSAPVTKAITQAQELASQIQLVSGNQLTGDDAMLLGSMFNSGYFSSVDSLSKAVTRAVFGKRVGIDVMTAITSLYIIDGKPAIEAQAIRNTCVMSGYNIDTIKLDGDECILEWSYKGKVLGQSKFTKLDAIRRGYVDPECADTYPAEHNEREIKYYNKWKKPVAGYETKTGCKCKDNWKSMPEEMMMARATTKGSRMYGNHAFKQEVYDADELRDSDLRMDTTAVDSAKINIEKAKTVEELQDITKELQPDELSELLPDISARTKELLSNDDSTTNSSGRSTA